MRRELDSCYGCPFLGIPRSGRCWCGHPSEDAPDCEDLEDEEDDVGWLFENCPLREGEYVLAIKEGC